MPASGQRQDMERIDKTPGKPVEDIGGISQTRKKQEYIAASAPIQKMKADSIYVHKLTFIGGAAHFFSFVESWTVWGVIPLQCTTTVLWKKVSLIPERKCIF